MKVISKWRLGNLQGTLYETTLVGETYYVYKVRYNRKVVAQSYGYFKDKNVAIEQMRSDMEQIFDSSKLEFIK